MPCFLRETQLFIIPFHKCRSGDIVACRAQFAALRAAIHPSNNFADIALNTQQLYGAFPDGERPDSLNFHLQAGLILKTSWKPTENDWHGTVFAATGY